MAFLRRILTLLVTVGLLLAPVAVLANRQDIIDWWRLRDYQPPARIAELAEHTTMSDRGRKLFYVHKPQLNDSQSFTANCPGNEQTIVLGCYITNKSIHIFDVEDERLDGVEEVTAAHEMLHAAYDRLSDDERSRVDSLTKQAFEKLDSKRIRGIIANYKAKDPSIVPNELHSILGTEVRELPSELEEYYGRYFSDRVQVVRFSEEYEAVFTEQRQKLDSLSNQITSLEQELGGLRGDIERRETELNSEAERLNQLRASGQIEEHNASVPAYNSLVNTYRDLVASYNQKVRRLNGLIEEYNQLAVDQKELIDALDSSL